MSANWPILERWVRKLGETYRVVVTLVVFLAINVAGFIAMSHGMVSTGAPGVIFLVLLVFFVGLVARRSSRR